MKAFIATLVLALGAGLVLAQSTSTSSPSTLHAGSGTGKVLATYATQGACRTSAASAPGSWMCKEPITTACVAPAASSAQTLACPAPLVGSWVQTTTPKMSATCVQTTTVTPTSAPAGACSTPPTTSWALLATEGKTFSFTGTRQVRIGVDWAGVWSAAVSVTGSGTCSMSFLKVPDPKPGSGKVCQVSGTADPVPPVVVPPVVEPPASSPIPMPGNPNVPIADASKWPALTQNPKGGWSTDMVIPTTEVAPPSDIGAFRTGCQATKFAFDDPIVYPGQPGKSHLHIFFGNTGINASSTAASLFGGGNSTCRGGTINRSSYWVPAIIDMRTKLPIAPMFESNFYYKTGYAVAPSAIAEVPLGLRMIAGNAMGNPSNPSSAAIYSCVWEGGNSNWFDHIPPASACPAVGYSWLIMGVDFPQCWDGVNLDSPDHKSHMTNPVNVRANNTGNCPASHPVALPQIAYQVLYHYASSSDLQYWRLASDNYDNTKPAGYSGHGDYMMAWKPEIVKVWTQKCDREQKDCHSHLLGDGRAMVIP